MVPFRGAHPLRARVVRELVPRHLPRQAQGRVQTSEQGANSAGAVRKEAAKRRGGREQEWRRRPSRAWERCGDLYGGVTKDGTISTNVGPRAPLLGGLVGSSPLRRARDSPCGGGMHHCAPRGRRNAAGGGPHGPHVPQDASRSRRGGQSPRVLCSARSRRRGRSDADAFAGRVAARGGGVRPFGGFVGRRRAAHAVVRQHCGRHGGRTCNRVRGWSHVSHGDTEPG